MPPVKRLIALMAATAAIIASLLPAGQSVNPASLLRRAQEARDRGEIDSAIDYYRRGLSADPENYDARFSLGLLLISKNHWDGAEEQFRRYAEKHPDSYEAHNNLAVVYARLGQSENLARALKSAARLRPGEASAHLHLSDYYLSQALRSLWRAVRSTASPERAGVQARLEALLASSPDSGEAAYIRASAARLNGDAEAARRLLARAAEFDPVFRPSSLAASAQQLAGVGETDEALEILLNLDATDQAPREARVLLAEIFNRLSRFEESIRALDKARAGSEGDLRYHLVLSEAWHGRGDAGKAVSALEAALAVEPTPEIRKRLAQAYTARGEFNRALGEYEKLLATGPDPAWVRGEIMNLTREKLRVAVKSGTSAGPASSAASAGIRIPDALVYIAPGELCTIVEKESQTLLVFRRSEKGFSLERTLACSTGAREGEKFAEGDEKTPEGIYLYRKVLPGSQLPEIYGRLAITLDYPNAFDQLEGKGGNGIWVHASNESIRAYLPNKTRGCVVVSNEDVQTLSRLIVLNRTPLVIVPRITYRPAEESAERERELRSFLEHWRASWEAMDLNSYIGCYSQRFRNQDQDIRGWRSYKQSVFSRAGTIQLRVDLESAIAFEKYSVLTFRQEYRSKRLTSAGYKRLFVVQEGGTWRIIAEVWRDG